MRRLSVLFSIAVLYTHPIQSIAAAFVDVPEGIPFRDAIVALQDSEIIHGYADGSFRPYRTLSRAEFVKLLVTAMPNSVHDQCATITDMPFIDVPRDAWFAKSACIAKTTGIVQGFADGSFGPGKAVTLAEAARMLALAFGATETTGDPWYRPSILFLGERNAIPATLGHPDQNITRAEAVEMLWRLRDNRTDLDHADTEVLLAARCETIKANLPKVDVQEVERAWLQWVNDARARENLAPYVLDRQLKRTAILWSQQSSLQGNITHKRSGQTAYYDYGRMVQWFDAVGLTFQNVQGTTFTENIGYGYYQCRAGDCTGEIIAAVRSTFDFYMREKNAAYRPHYNSIMNPVFQSIGIGVALDNGKYYITTHYGTRITSDPVPVCVV